MEWIIFFAAILLTSFFAGSEVSILSVKKINFNSVDKGKHFLGWTQKQNQFWATLNFGYFLFFTTSVVFGSIIFFQKVLGFGFPKQLSIAVFLVILIFAILLPIILNCFYCSIFAKKVINYQLIVLKFFYYIFSPVVIPVKWISLFFFSEKSDNKVKFGELFWKTCGSNIFTSIQIDKRGNFENPTDAKIFRNVMEFSQVRVKECMVPRNEIVAVEVNAGIEELRQKFVETGYSKIVVYSGSNDNVVGYVHSSGLFKNPANIKSMLYKLLIVPESMPARKMLHSFLKERKSLGIVVDEFGGISGIVTVEDIIEEIFGEIMDEHDSEEHIEKQISENEYLFSGRLEIDYLNDKYRLDLPDSEQYETLAGLILFYHEKIPKLNEIIYISGFQINVIKVSDTKIELVKLLNISSA